MTDAVKVAIIGGGPAGLIAADVLAAAGHSVTVFDQMRSVGRKFLLAGRSGLNITNSEPLDDFLNRYGPDRDFLEPAIRGFTPTDLRAWCYGLNEATFVGSSGRVFPESFRATPLLRSLLVRLGEHGVQFQTQRTWTGWDVSGMPVFLDAHQRQHAVGSGATVLALGGASWPRTGASAQWVPVLAGSGVAVRPFTPSNCGVQVDWSAALVQRFAGTPLKNMTFHCNGTVSRGEAVVTTSGLEGGAIYALSRPLRRVLERDGSATIAIDLQPDRHLESVTAKLSHRKPKESVSNWLRHALGLTPVAIGLLREVTHNAMPGAASELAALVKSVPVRVAGLAAIDRAISSAGGIDQAEVDASFQLRARPGVYAVGEMLDWDAPTGGYLLQATFSTAVAAARAIIQSAR